MEEAFMKLAIAQAEKALKQNEVPVGAVIVLYGKVIAKAHNKRQTNGDASAHAEIIAIRKACKKIGGWRLLDCDMYVTLEPCAMCAGAAINSRLKNIFFGAYDEKSGCCGTIYNLPEDKRFNHVVKVTGGVLEKECATILSKFFSNKRKSKEKAN